MVDRIHETEDGFPPPPLILVYSFGGTLVFIFYSLLYFARGHPSSHLPVADVGDPPLPHACFASWHVLPFALAQRAEFVNTRIPECLNSLIH